MRPFNGIRLFYLQSGQQPVAPTLVAAAAAVPNSATSAAAYPTSFIFINVLLVEVVAIHPPHDHGTRSGLPEGQGLDLQVHLKVLKEGMAGLLIGDVARRSGVSTPTIRYYEEIGLLPKPHRSSTGYRRYSENTVDDLRFIKKAQTLGFSLEEVGEILKLSRSGKIPCSHVLSLAHGHLAAVEERIRQLQSFRDHLASEVAKWDAEQKTVTCDGLCQLIADAEPSGELKLHLSPPELPSRARKARS